MPPVSVMVALPDDVPQPGCIMLTVCASAAGSVITAVAVVVQLLFALMVTVYVPGASPIIVGVVCTGVVFQL